MKNISVSQNQSSRIYYLDLARGLAIFFMIMQHAMIMHEKSGGEGKTILGNIFILLGTAPAAPVFMFVMGIFFMKSEKSFKQSIIRGFKLLLLGYVLNFLRFTFPILLARAPYSPGQDPISMLFVVDILQLAGLSLIFLSKFKKYANSKYVLPALILIILLVSPYLWGKFNNISIFLPLWGSMENIEFPFFPWSIYFLLGMYLSKYLINKTLSDNIRKNLLMFSLILGTIGVATFNIFPIGDYHRSGLSIHFLIISFVLIWLVLCDYIIKKIAIEKKSCFLNLLFFWSKNVTSLYIIQWVLYGWSILLIGVHNQPDYIAFFIGLCVLTITHLLLKYTKFKKSYPINICNS